MADNDDVKNFLASHPRMIGALFTIMLLLSQSGTAVAGGGYARVGP